MSAIRQFQQEAEQLAAQFNVSSSTAREILCFLHDRIQSVPEFQFIAQHGTDAQKTDLIERGMKAWFEQSQALYQELLENKTERAKKWRSMIYDEVKSSVETQDQEECIDDICSVCAGSGEGQYDGTRCMSCKGAGVENLIEKGNHCE